MGPAWRIVFVCTRRRHHQPRQRTTIQQLAGFQPFHPAGFDHLSKTHSLLPLRFWSDSKLLFNGSRSLAGRPTVLTPNFWIRSSIYHFRVSPSFWFPSVGGFVDSSLPLCLNSIKIPELSSKELFSRATTFLFVRCELREAIHVGTLLRAKRLKKTDMKIQLLNSRSKLCGSMLEATFPRREVVSLSVSRIGNRSAP